MTNEEYNDLVDIYEVTVETKNDTIEFLREENAELKAVLGQMTEELVAMRKSSLNTIKLARKLLA